MRANISSECGIALLLCALAACSSASKDESARGAPNDVAEAEPVATCVQEAPTEWEPVAAAAARYEVNRGTPGVTSRVRWVISPDSAALLVLDDPVGVKNEPVPNGALFASERTSRVWQMDELWSVAPSPDWRRLAYSRAIRVHGGSAQIVPAQWDSVARAGAAKVGNSSGDSLRAHVFQASGQQVVESVAASFVDDVIADAPAAARFVGLDGWRVLWSCDGADLLLGNAPRRVSDDAPNEGERRVSSRGEALSAAAAAEAPHWTDPTLEPGSRAPRAAAPRLVVRGRVIEGRAGRVIVRDSGAAVRDVGPGVPLAATRYGHLVLAIAPGAGARGSRSAGRAIVYRVP